jgi:neural Wiskott-Aldrich syndrome protein
VIVFKGDEKPAKEWECVLIYDEATQTFTLEKLDSLVNLNFDAKVLPRTRPAAPSRTSSLSSSSNTLPHSPLPPRVCTHARHADTNYMHLTAPSASSSSAAQTPRRSPVRTAADELEAQLEVASAGLSGVHNPDADADGEPDPNFREEEEGAGVAPPPPPPPRSSAAHHHQKAAPQAAPQSKARPAPSKKSAATSQSTKAARVSAANVTPAPSSSKSRPRPIPPAPVPVPPPISTPTMQGSSKRTVAALESRDVEDFEVRGPIAPMIVTPSGTRRPSTATATAPPVAQAPGSSFGLALPSASSGPDPLAHQGLYHHGGGHAASSGAVDSDEEWDEILAQPDRAHPPPPPPHHHNHHHHHQQQQQQEQMLTITIEDEEDGLDFLERELLGEDERMADGDADGDEDEEMEEEMVAVGHHHNTSRAGAGTGPMSMNQFAGGEALVEDEDDDYSSSEESDED